MDLVEQNSKILTSISEEFELLFSNCDTNGIYTPPKFNIPALVTIYKIVTLILHSRSCKEPSTLLLAHTLDEIIRIKCINYCNINYVCETTTYTPFPTESFIASFYEYINEMIEKLTSKQDYMFM